MEEQAVLDVLSEVEFSVAHWRELGRQLMPKLDLDAIENQYLSLDRRLEKVIERWKCDGDDPSWERLAVAVSQCKMGGGRIMAMKILQKFRLGEAVI